MTDVTSSSSDAIPAKVSKPKTRARAKVTPAVVTPEARTAKVVKPKAQVKARVAGVTPGLVPGDAEKAEARKLENARLEGAMEYHQMLARSEALAARNQALRDKLDSRNDYEPMSDAQKFEFARLQRAQEQDTETFKKAAGTEKLAKVEPMSTEQSFASARTRQAEPSVELENSIEAGPEREAAQESNLHDTKLFRSIVGSADRNMSGPAGGLSQEEASIAVTDDLEALRGIKDKKIHRLALLAIGESKHAQIQYRMAIDRVAPDISAAASVAGELERGANVQQEIHADAKATNARWTSMGKQMQARTPGQVAADFAVRYPLQPFPSELPVDRTKAMPEAVKARYLKVDNDYFFPDKTPAFVDRGTKLATRGENAEVIKSLVSIAKARGWGNVTVKGTEQFRRAAWHEASLNGMEVAGYTPTRVEQAHLAAAKEAKTKAMPDNSIEQGRAVNIATAQEKSVRTANDKTLAAMNIKKKDASRTPPAASHAPAFAQLGGVVGKLINHGKAPYMHDKQKEDSYFVTVDTGKDAKTVWGVDLGRAIAQSGVKIGETISVKKQSSQGVVAQERVFDAGGKEIGRRPVDTHKNKWSVGSLDKASAFAQGQREEVVKEHPDLAGAYGTVAAAQAFAMQHFPGHEERFAAIGKAIIAADIAAGKDVPAVKIREVQQVNTKDQEHAPGQDQDRERA